MISTPAGAKVISGILLRVLSDLIDCTIQLIQKHPGSPPASLRVPIDSRLGFFQRSRVDSQGLDAHRSSRSRRRPRAALQDIRSTLPSSICFSRSSISLFHVSVAPSSTVASRLSIRESISAERASGGKARASRSRSAGWLSMNRYYRAGAATGTRPNKESLPITAFLSSPNGVPGNSLSIRRRNFRNSPATTKFGEFGPCQNASHNDFTQ